MVEGEVRGQCTGFLVDARQGRDCFQAAGQSFRAEGGAGVHDGEGESVMAGGLASIN